jgi:glycosyltransferase involved in cell wall biosynthesis
VIGKTLLSQCDLVLGVSQYTLDSTLPKCFRGVSAVAYNGVDNKLFKPHESNVCNELDSVHTALCIARFVKQKGLDYLIEAFSRLNATLVLIGRGPEEKNLRRKAKEVGAKVFFITQRVSEQVLADYYAACDVFVLPSLWEPFGIVLVEAMASAKPIVATNVGGIPEIVSAKEGFLVPPKNTSALSQGIRFLLENPRKAKAMGVAGRKKALRKFTWDETAKAYEKAYQQLG